MEQILQTSDLGKCYKSKWAIQEFNLSLRRGEIVGFIGPNGAGKSTVISLLAGLIAPSKGKIYRSEALRNSGISVVSERFGFIPYLSGRKNLELLASIRGQCNQNAIERSLRIVKLDPSDKRPISAYSLGMRQRLMIAQAILDSPQLLLLDEPTNGLDPDGVMMLRSLLQDLASNNVAIFLASHLLTEVERICHRVLLVKEGRLVREMNLQSQESSEIRIAFTTQDDLSRFMKINRYASDVKAHLISTNPSIILTGPYNLKSVMHDIIDNDISIEEITKRGRSLENSYLEILN